MSNRIVIAASGSGSNFKSILDAISRSELDAIPAGLIASKETIGAVEIAHKAGIEVFVLQKGEDIEAQFHDCIKKWKPDLLILAGFLKKIPSSVIRAMPERILNIHPSLLPDFGGKGFYGIRVHEAVLQSGCSESGCTVHLVNEAYDEGRILAQSRVSIKPDDTPETLAARVLAEEHKLYPAVIKSYLQTLNRQKL